MYGFYYLAFNASSWMLSYNVFNMSAVRFGPATIALMNQSGLINSQLTVDEHHGKPELADLRNGSSHDRLPPADCVPVVRESVPCLHGSPLRHPVGAAARRLWDTNADQHLL